MNETLQQPTFSITQSEALWQRALKHIPAGTQCYSKGPTAYTRGFAPVYLQRGKGCRVWDADGNEFIDLGMGLWAVTLGHADPRHCEAVERALRAGNQLSLMHPLEVELAEALAVAIPAAEMVRYAKNGSDVTTAAVRLARTCTGRDVILRCGYHGWHDWYVARSEHTGGVPDFNREITGCFEENDRAGFDALMSMHEGRVAGVILEGIQMRESDPAFLTHLRHETRKAGALLIFDEVINGYRFALGGAHERLTVDVDLATFGKGIGNGTPMAALVGKREVMQRLDDTFFSLTFGGETLGLAAALEVLRIYRSENVIGELHAVGARLHSEAVDAIRRAGLEAWIGVSPHEVRTVWTFGCPYAGCDPLILKSLLQQEILRRGVLWGGWHALCQALARDIEAQERVITAFHEALEVVSHAVACQRVAESLEGKPITPIFKRH